MGIEDGDDVVRRVSKYEEERESEEVIDKERAE